MTLRLSPDNQNTRPQLESLLTRLAELQGMPILCLYQNGDSEEHLDYDCLVEVRRTVPKLAPFGKVAVLLDSPGGDIEYALRIIKIIRRYSEEVRVLVADWAKSAATFFCLACDAVYLGENGELGPLDPQLLDRRGSDRSTSALETFKALEYLRNYSMEVFSAIVTLLVRENNLDVPYAIDHAKGLASSIVSTLYQQVDPHELGEARRYLAVSEEYTVRAMKRWSYPELPEDEIRHIVSRLVWEYPSHGFAIDYEEAQLLGLTRVHVLDPDSDNICDEILSLVNGCTGVWFPEDGTVSAVSIPAEEKVDGNEAGES